MSLHNTDRAVLTRRQAREQETGRAAKSKSKSKSSPKSRTKPKPRKRAASFGSKLVSLGAMTAAAALLVAVSVPASAFMSDAAPVALAERQVVIGQSVVVSGDATETPVDRDTFTSVSYAELLRQQYGNVSKSFTVTTGAIRWPFPYAVPITDGFGDRPSGTSGTSHHNGVDFVPGAGTPIYAVADGIVFSHTEDTGGYGNNVLLRHDVNDMKFDSLYAHMQLGSSPLVVGDAVKVGDFVGLVGNSGDSYGAHLHLEIRFNNVPVDPFAWLTTNAV